jgi:hypothetical protein
MVSSPTSDHMEGAETREAYRRTMFDAICVIALIAYFLHFALAALRGGFREDEMMNLYVYWHAGALKSLWANVSFWTPFYRPGGALYYLPLYSFYGLNPQPYRITQIIILAASIPILYHFVLSRSNGQSRIRRCLHLRCIMRFFLLRGTDVLYSHSRERNAAATRAITGISGVVHLRVELQGDGGQPSPNHFNL